MRKDIGLDQFDVVFANPPFGSRLPVDDAPILEQFDLAYSESRSIRTNMPPEQLFVERCLRFLKPGGRMAIVLPDSILSNPGLTFLRQWVLRNAWVIASVDLPREMFARSDTHTKTSVLILQRFTDEEKRLVSEMGRAPEYEVFMAIAEHVGWDLRGQPVYLRTPEGEEILQKSVKTVMMRNAYGEVIEGQGESEEPLLNDQLPEIATLFERWLVETSQRWRQHA